MKKTGRWCLIGLVVMATVWAYACGSDKYAEAKSLLKDQTRIAVNYINGLEKAASADDAAGAINTYTDEMKELIPRIKAYQKKYPELTGMSPSADTPDDVKVEMKKLEEAMGKIQSATMNMMKYMMDPKVQQAMQRMGKELGPLGST